MIASDERPLTGRKVLIITLVFFGVIIAANVTMMVSAIRTFPGLEVANSYVASQEFDARARAQRALGWEAEAVASLDGVRLQLRDSTGVLIAPDGLIVKIGHPTNAAHDQVLEFRADADGLYAPAQLAPGPWRLFVDATAPDGTAYSTRLSLVVE